MRQDNGRHLIEEITVTGGALLDKVKDLIQQGNIRRLIVRRPSGKVLADIPLTAGVGIAGVLTLLAPVLTAMTAIGALFAQFRLEIQRDPDLFIKRADADRDDCRR